MKEHWTPIAAIDVAVVDPDLLWRVEHMNLFHGAVAKEYAAPEEALDAMTPGHRAVIVLGPRVIRHEVRTAVAAQQDRPELRIVVCTLDDEPPDEERTRAEGADEVIPSSVTDNTFVRIVHDVFVKGRDVSPVAEGGSTEPATATVEPTLVTETISTALAAPPPSSARSPVARPVVVPAAGHVAEPADNGGQASRPAADTKAAEQAPALEHPRTIPPRLALISSAKGGEGSSTVALNLACSIAEVAGTRTAVVDAEPYFGDIITDFGGPARPAAIVRQLPIPDDVVEQLVSRPEPDGPLVVRSPQVGPELTGRRVEVIRELLRIAGERADVVVADVPLELMIEADLASEAAIVALVCSRRTTSIKNTIIAAQRLGSADNIGVVFNELDARHRVTFVEELAGEIGLPLLGHLPYSGALHRNASRPRPNEVADPGSRYAKEMTAARRAIASRFPTLV